MQVNRRGFFKAVGLGTGAGLLLGLTESKAGLAASSLAAQTSSGKVMLYDSTRCVGCRACQTACKQWNHFTTESTGYGEIYDNLLWGCSFTTSPIIAASGLLAYDWWIRIIGIAIDYHSG